MASLRPISPSDEYILFTLIEFDRRLPREEQSRRFDVTIYKPRGGGAPTSEIRGDNSSQSITLNASPDTFLALQGAGYVKGGQVRTSRDQAEYTRNILYTVVLTSLAFEYYDDKHDSPTALAEARREFVGSSVSTEYPEVVSHLKQAYEDIWLDQPEGNWSSVAHRCDDALETFADLVWKPTYAHALAQDEPPKAKYVDRLDQVIRNAAQEEELRGLLVKLQRYLAARRHDSGTTHEEAKRIVLYS